MKLLGTIAAAAALCIAGAGAPAFAQTKTIYVGMNGGPMEKAYTSQVLPDFEKANDVKVVVVPGTSSDILAKATAAKGNPQMHVMFLDDGVMVRAVGAGLCEKIKDTPALADLAPGARLKDDMAVGMHMCRGNHESSWAAEGGYDPVAELAFGSIDVDALFLEYDSPRAGGFEPLRFLPKGKTAALGLVTTKSPKLESKDDLKRRIDEAARFAPLEQLALSPQCGFSSGIGGETMTPDDQRRKLELVVETAREVWG